MRRLQVVVQPLEQETRDWLVIGLFTEDQGELGRLGEMPLGLALKRLREEKSFKAALGETLVWHVPPALPAPGVVVVGLGGAKEFGAGAAFRAGVAVARKRGENPEGALRVWLTHRLAQAQIARALVEGLIVGGESPGLCKGEPDRHPLAEVTLVLEAGAERDVIQEAARCGEVAGEAVNWARRLVNLPPSQKPPATLARLIAEKLGPAGVQLEIMQHDRIVEERLGGVLGVAAGSSQPPVVMRLEYNGVPDGPVLALVGKGVTFDSGGLSLKTSAAMEDMKADMSGAAIVAATVWAAARLALPVRVDAVLPLTENMTGGSAMKLGDVLTMRDGTTVEVMNTDAEGRLILADALCLAAERQPARMIDLATLTGACMVALGPRTAGLFCGDEGLAEELSRRAHEAGEPLWRLPLDATAADQLKSPVADLKNVGGKYGGAITAALFLERFTAGIPWAHLDIAGPSWADKESACQDAGASGCFIRTLLAYLETPRG